MDKFYYYKMDGIIKNSQKMDTVYIRAVRELGDTDAWVFMNGLYSDNRYYAVYFNQTGENAVFMDNVIFGAAYYHIRCLNAMDAMQDICISGITYPSGKDMMKFNKYLNDRQKIKHIYFVEEISVAKMLAEYRDGKWIFPETWLIPFEYIP